MLRQRRDEELLRTPQGRALHRVCVRSIDALEPALHEYNCWHYKDRISIKLEGLSPVQYRAQPSWHRMLFSLRP
ncbi:MULTISPECIES: IS3 family transposase [unclassified Arthrobacter]|uniref:IS3 family transposase n=1 Tax=unclassified Arthrobacter TaxID=235627 RepID=UPI0035B064E0